MERIRETCRSTPQLAEALKQQGHRVGRQKICELLGAPGYSLQSNRKTREGSDHADRDAQFAYINAQVSAYQQRAQPVISVDTKKLKSSLATSRERRSRMAPPRSARGSAHARLHGP